MFDNPITWLIIVGVAGTFIVREVLRWRTARHERQAAEYEQLVADHRAKLKEELGLAAAIIEEAIQNERPGALTIFDDLGLYAHNGNCVVFNTDVIDAWLLELSHRLGVTVEAEWPEGRVYLTYPAVRMQA